MASTWEETLIDIKKGCDSNAEALKTIAQKLQKRHYIIGIPALALSLLSGATIVTAIDVVGLRIALGIISLISIVSSGITTFINYGKRAEKSSEISGRYKALSHDIDEILLFPPNTAVKKKTILTNVHATLDKILKDTKPYLLTGIEEEFKLFSNPKITSESNNFFSKTNNH